MAKLKDLILPSANHMKIGGAIYNDNRYGTYAMVYTAGTRTKPARNLTLQAYTVQAIHATDQLTSEQIRWWRFFTLYWIETDWQGYAMRQTWYHWFVRLNARRLDAGFPIIYEAPEEFSMPANASGFQTTGIPGHIWCEWTPYAEGHLLELYISTRAVGRPTASKHRIRLYSRQIAVVGGEIIEVPSPGYYHVWYRIMRESSGHVSSWGHADAVTT